MIAHEVPRMRRGACWLWWEGHRRSSGHARRHGRVTRCADARPGRSLSFEPELLVWRRRRHVGDEPNRRLRDAGPERADAGLLPQWRVHDLLVNELLDPVEDRLALAAVHFARELSHQPFDVGIGPVREGTGRRHVGVEPGRRVPEGGAAALDDGPEPFVLVLLDEGRALQWTDGRADARRAEVVD